MRTVGVLVNLNAHQVTSALVRELRARLGTERVYATRSVAEARAAIAAIVAAQLEVLCIAGGDGTFICAAEELFHLAPARPPILFALRLGLGNAIADLSGASAPTSAGLAHDLARAAGGEAPWPLPLLRANDRIAYYAGVGADADFVADLYQIAKGPLRAWSARWHGAPGLIATVALRTLPRFLTRRPLRVRIVNLGAPALRLDAHGEALGAPIPRHATLYEGPALVAAAGTIPSYGRRFWFFPLAERLPPGRLSLRVWSSSPLDVLRHLPSIWRGTYFPRDGVRDWAAEAVAIQWTLPAPIHIGGDLGAPTTELRLEMLPWCAPILRRVTPASRAPPLAR